MLSVSVITPSFNQGRFIERTIQSVLQQNVNNMDYWIIDGGSNDETLTILKKYETTLKWISEKDKGQTHAVNKGIERTKGDIICWLNSDDIYYPNTINTVIDFFTANPSVDIIYGNANHIDENDSIIEAYYTEQWNFERFKEVCYLSQPAVFFRRDMIKKFGLLDETLNYCMDYEYWMRLALGGAAFVYLPEYFAGSRLYQDNKTLGARLEVHEEINNMLKKKLKKVPNRWLSNYAHVKASVYPTWKHPRWRFVLLSSFLTLLASIRWNKSVNLALLVMVLRWLSSSLKVIKFW